MEAALSLRSGFARSCACLALLCSATACSDSQRTDGAGTDGAATQPPGIERHDVLPPEGAGNAQAPGNPEDIARASATDLAREPNTVDWSGGDSAHGQAIYVNQCALCHGGGGTGNGFATPAINPKPRDFTQGRYYIDASANNQTGEDVDLARVILHGPRAFGGTLAMPAFEGQLSESDVRDVIAYVRTLAHS